MEKVANLTKEDLEEIAAYINITSGTSIDVAASKSVLEEQIKNVVRTGYSDNTSNIDSGNKGVALVQQMSMKRALDKIRSNVGSL